MSTTLTISLPDDLDAKLRAQAATEDRPVSRVAVAYIAAGLLAVSASAPRPPSPKRAARRGRKA